MKNSKPTLEEFCHIYPELLAQAREYAEGTIVDPVVHDDAVESCICDFMEGARAAIENTYPSGHSRQEVLLQCFM